VAYRGVSQPRRHLRAKLVKELQWRFNGFDDKMLSMYALGMSVRDVQGHLTELFGTEISPDLISPVTD
jgi:putative transposase